jgi:hypothetical protein
MKVKKSVAVKTGIITSLAIIALLVWHFGISTLALFDSENAVHINPDEIENSTLIIGTHLIYIHSLNDEIYNIALDSASASGQENVYYKSELADGMWFDITDATSIADISSSGVIVSNDEIAALDMTHHTKSDGITYDLRTNQAVCIFDIYDVYDLENMEELEQLKMQYDTMRESGSNSKLIKRNITHIQNFFSMSVTSDTTMDCDEKIKALQGYYEELVSSGADSGQTQMVLKVMSKLDYERKAAVYNLVDIGLSNLEDIVADVSDDDENSVDEALLSAIGNSQYSIGESMSEAEGNMLSKGDTVLSQKEYELSNGLISNAVNHNYSGCDKYNDKLRYLDNINNSRIVDRTSEISLLDELIESADSKYSESLSSGQSSEYNELVNRNASNAALQSRIKEDVVNTNAVRGELQFLIQSKTDRMESDSAQEYILQRIQDIAVFRKVIKNDDYRSSLSDNVSQYLEWLNNLLKNIKSEGTDNSTQQSLYEQKASLQQQKLEALDNLDIDTSKRIDAQIKELDSQIDQIENNASSNLEELLRQKADIEKSLENNSNDTALQDELSQIESLIADNSTDMDDKSLAANVMNAKSQIMDALASGDMSSSTLDMISGNVDILTSALEGGSALALEALKEIYNKMLSKSELENADGYNNMIDDIEQSVADSSINSSLSGELSVNDATSAIEDFLGVDSFIDSEGNVSSEVSDSDLAAVLIALGDFDKKISGDGTDQSSQVASFTDGLISGLNQSGAGITFQTYKQSSEQYIPVKALAEYAGYRYIWNDTKKEAVLSRGRTYYSFIAFKETVENEKGDILYMDMPASFSGEIYIPSSFASEIFNCYANEISKTNYSVIVNDTVVEKSQQLLSELLEKGGY